MAAVHALVLFHIVFGFLHQSLGLISDYKLCGDPECESMISRVQAQRDHSAKDCRFLNFKKGDIITVYYKLTGKRNDLWAGSMEKLSGLFPKDAIKIDQLFIDEKKEIQVPTQEYDFICFDEKGLVIEHSTEFEDLEDLSQETQETDLNEVRDKPTETEEREPSQNSVQDVSDQNTPETTETGGSSWIGSAVNGWFGRNEQSNDEPQDESSEESFKSRKIVMDIEENLMEEKTNSGTFGWISGELTNAFGFGNKELKTDAQDNIENPTNDEDTSSQQSSSWMSMGRDVLGFSEENTDAATKPEAEKEDENTNMEDQSTLNPSQNMDVADNIQGDENTPDDIAENNDSSLDDRITENEKEEKQAGWYGNMYNRITNLYKEDNEGKASVSENPASATSTEDKTKESESSSQSIFSVSGLKSMLKLPFQEDTVVTKDEEKTEKEEDTRKEEIQHNNMDQEEEMLIDIDEQDSNQIDTDVLASDDVKQLDEESNMTEDSTDSQILEENSADNLNEEVKSENKADFFEEKVEQDAKDVQSDEEKTGKEEDPGKKDFDEEQEDKMLTDSDEQESNQIDIDILNVTQSLSDKTMTLQDSIASDSTEQLDVESNMMEESIDSQILEKKSVDNINEEVKCESNADFLEGKVEQDTRDVQSEEKTVKEEDPRKEYLDEEKNNNKDQEEKMLIDIHEQDSNTIDTDVFSETQSLSLKESTASDSTEQLDVESNMTEDSTDSQTLEIKSADHLYEEVKSENNADFIEENMDQDMRDVQSEEKSGKEEDPGKEDFDKEQNNHKDQEEKMLVDIREQDSNAIDTDVFRETQMQSDKTMTLKDSIASDSTEQLVVESNMMEDSTDSQTTEIKSADNLYEVKSENNADFIEENMDQDTRNVQKEEKTGKQEDLVKEDFHEEQNNFKDQEEKMLIDINEKVSNPIDTGIVSETQSLSDKTMTLKENIASDSTEQLGVESNIKENSIDSQILEIKSADILNEEVKSENNADFIEGKMDQDTRDVQSEEKSEKDEDPGKEDFDEEQNNHKDQEEKTLVDIREQDSNTIDTDVFSETLIQSDKTLTLKESIASDSTEQLDVESSMTENSTDSLILDIKSDFIEENMDQDTRDVQNEEKTGTQEDPVKEDFEEEQNTFKDQEEKMLIDINEKVSNPTDTDVLSETQSLSDNTVTLKETIASDSTEQLDVESNMKENSIDSQILDKKSADNLSEEVKSENNADFLEGKTDQDTREVQSEEKTGKQEDPVKEHFDEEQNNFRDQEEKMLIDINEKVSNPIDTDVLSKTQSLSDKTITLNENIASDSTEQLYVESNMKENSIDSQILDKKSADNLSEEVKSENNADFLEGKMDQDTREVQSEEKTGKQEDPVKEDFDEEQNNFKDQEVKMLIDINEKVSNPIDTDVLSETQSLSDKTMTLKENTAPDSTEQLEVEFNVKEDSTDSQILEIKSADNLNEEIKIENDEVLEGVVEQDAKDVQSDEEKTGKEVNSGKEDFLEQQNVKDEEIYESVKQESTTKDVHQASSDETMILKDSVASNDITDIDGFSKESNTQHSDDVTSANNTTDEVIQSENNLTDSVDDILEGTLTQSPSDQANLDTIKQQENYSNEISTDPVTGEDTSKLSESDIQTDTELHYEKTQESNVADLNADSHIESVKTDQSVNADVNSELTLDAFSENNKEKQLAEGDQGILKENDELVLNRNEAQLDEALPNDITFHEEKLPDSEAHATPMSNEQKLDTNINPLDERSSYIHTLVTSEETLHSELESNSALNITDYNYNARESHHESLVIENSKDTDSVGKNDNEVVVHEEQEESGTVSEPTENYFETKEKEDDTQITNESLTQETQAKSPLLNTSDGSGDLKDGSHDLSSLKHGDIDNIPSAMTEDPDGYRTSTETELTNDFFSKNDSVQDENINIMHDQTQSAEHKEETDTANNEDRQTDSESVKRREESDTGAIWDQRDDGDTAVKLEDKKKHGNEKQPGNPEIQDKNTVSHPTETSTEYANLYPYLSKQVIEDLLDLFGDQKLSWLDSKMGNTNAGQDNDVLDELDDIEQLLEYYMKMNTKLGRIQQDNGVPGKDNTKEYSALQKLFTLLSSLRKKYSPVITDNSVESPGVREDDCIHEACLDVNKNTQQMISTTEVENNQVSGDTSVLGNPQNEPVFEEKDLSGITDNVEDVHTDEQEIRKHEDWASSETKKTTFQNDGLISEEHIEALNGLRQFYQMAVFVEVTINEIASIVDKVVSSLPDDIRPGPDLYGLPWEAVVFTGFLGLLTLLLFSCRFIHSIKSRLYASKEKQMAQKVAELLDEKCKVLETFSEVKQKFDKLESTLQNNGMSAQAAEKDSLEVASQKLEQSNAQMKKEIERLQEELSQQNKARKQQEDQLAELEQILRNLEEEAKERKSQLEQDNTTLKIHEINTERLQKNLQAAKEEHAMLLESKAQLVQEAEDWGERLGELEEEMKMCERSHTGMLEDCANKDDRIKSLTECLLKMRDWDSEDESCVDGSTNTAGAENGDSSDFRQKQKVQKLIEAAKMSADLKSMEEDKNRVFAKLADEIKAKEDLQEGIKQLEEQKEVLESESANYASESQKLQQKLQIMTEMYQENELKLHRMLTVEEKERLQKEEKLNKAGKKISLAAEELNTYRQRAKDLEEELERTSQAYKNQIVSHEKKAHDNWLAARAADRDLADVKRENAHLRQRLTDSQFKFEILEKDVREGRPLFRGERSPYGPSPLSRPSSETRAFLSPPTLMDGPPRLSPQFMGPGRGHPLPDPGLPFKRPPPGPYPMGPLPPRPPLPPEPYFADKSDSSFLRNSSSISENESREGPHSMPGDMRLPPDPDSRMGPPPGPRLMGMPPLMDPRDPHFPPRGPYGPPEFFPPRGPGGPPIGMRGPLPPGMFPRAPMPLPQHMGYLPPRPQSDSFPPGPPPRPSPPGSEQPPNQSPSPHDVI
ncbi:transport and Golgi organization protein 1 homolog isoform X2 [Labeo rohita]|uniref:transport and Golgi organization protein 1 homolog isoform X2 n=1 Tax=Labeo rohita TaxID=84645 RepID=UPI0021E22806|nr:transport and Golgi organization protein 1 homolog isoform X2 [Labeo rohita]